MNKKTKQNETTIIQKKKQNILTLTPNVIDQQQYQTKRTIKKKQKKKRHKTIQICAKNNHTNELKSTQSAKDAKSNKQWKKRPADSIHHKPCDTLIKRAEQT